MSLATTTFGVNHIVAGVAINLIAPGVARFMASELFVGRPGRVGHVVARQLGQHRRVHRAVPVGRRSVRLATRPTSSAGSRTRGWFMIADVAGLAKGLTTAVTLGRRAHDRACSSASRICCGTCASASDCDSPASGRRRPTRSACRCTRCAGSAWRCRARWPAWAAPCSCCSPTATRRTRSPVAASSASPR